MIQWEEVDGNSLNNNNHQDRNKIFNRTEDLLRTLSSSSSDNLHLAKWEDQEVLAKDQWELQIWQVKANLTDHLMLDQEACHKEQTIPEACLEIIH
jgi:hypothetical protein